MSRSTALTKSPQYAVQRASDSSTPAKSVASANANLLGPASGDAEDDLANIICSELPDALQFIDTEMGQKRAKATEYYMGELFGNEEEGRSKVVSRDVLAVVQALMPSIMRTFFGGRRRIRYRPTQAQDVPGAEQATEFVNSIVLQLDNNGFLEFYAAAKDALLRYKGVFKVWQDDAREITTDTYTGQDEDGLMMIANDPEISDVRVYKEMHLPNTPQTYAVVAKRTVVHVNKTRFGAVPPEELLVNRDARSVANARFLDHRRVMTLGELMALGYDKDELLPYTSKTSLQWSPEVMARQPSGVSTMLMTGMNPAELNYPITYHEVYTRADMDGDEYPELIKACGAGDGADFNLLHWEPVSEIPFCSIDPDPEPHTLFGLCPGGNVMDVQLIKSALLRMNLDGAALALDPRLEVVEHMVELDDLLNPEIGGIVRVRAPGQIAPVRYDFNPLATQGLLDYMDQVIEDRTGRSRASAGLDADALQSSSKLAVAGVFSGAQQQQEIICRLFAESGVKDLFRLILRFLCRHANQPRMMKFRGEWVSVDPRTWNSDMDVDIEVAVGVGGVEMEIQALLERKATQEAILQLYGSDNPIVTVAMYRNTLAKLDELRGLPDTDEAYKPVDPNWKPPASSVPSEAEVLQQTAQAELQLKREISIEELKLKREEMLLNDHRERVKIANDFQAKLAQAEASAKQEVNVAQHEHEAQLEAQRMEHESTVIEHLITGMTDVHATNTDAATQQAMGHPPVAGA